MTSPWIGILNAISGDGLLPVEPAWAAGFADSLAGVIDISETHCSLPSFTVVPDIVGLDAVDADAAILAAGMIVGTVTNATDPVTAQGTVAGTLVNPGQALDYTLTV